MTRYALSGPSHFKDFSSPCPLHYLTKILPPDSPSLLSEDPLPYPLNGKKQIILFRYASPVNESTIVDSSLDTSGIKARRELQWRWNLWSFWRRAGKIGGQLEVTHTFILNEHPNVCYFSWVGTICTSPALPYLKLQLVNDSARIYEDFDFCREDGAVD